MAKWPLGFIFSSHFSEARKPHAEAACLAGARMGLGQKGIVNTALSGLSG